MLARKRFCAHNYQLKALDSVQTWKLLKKFHQNFIIGIYFLNHDPNIKVFVKLFSKSLQGVACSSEAGVRERRPPGQQAELVRGDGVPRFYVGYKKAVATIT